LLSLIAFEAAMMSSWKPVSHGKTTTNSCSLRKLANWVLTILIKEFDPIKLAEQVKKDMGKAPDITYECVGFASSVSSYLCH
jgi:hypothetical protein